MKTKSIVISMLVILALCVAAISCNKDTPSTPTNPDNPEIPDSPTDCIDPENAITVNLRNDGGSVTILDCPLMINTANNFVSSSNYLTFMSVGEVSGLGCVTTVPQSGWSSQVAVIPGDGYVLKYRKYDESIGSYIVLYARLYVVRYILSATNEGILGAEIKYQDNWSLQLNYSMLRLNELNGNDKFIEIYNTGGEPINLNGVYIEKDGVLNWSANNTVSIRPGGYLLLYSEDVTYEHPNYPESLIFHSGLSAKKNVRIQIFTPTGESIDDFNLVDIHQNDPAYIPAPASYSRNANGIWYYADGTPGFVNVDGIVPLLGLEGGAKESKLQ